MKDLIGFDSYKIILIGGLESQEINITNGEEATEMADRLRKFLHGSYEVILEGHYSGEAVFNVDGEYLHSINERREELAF